MSRGKHTGCKENLNDLHHVECDLYNQGICSDMNEIPDTTVFEYQKPQTLQEENTNCNNKRTCNLIKL